MQNRLGRSSHISVKPITLTSFLSTVTVMKIRKRLSPLLIVLREGELVKKLTFQLKTKRELSGGGKIEHKYLLAFAHICHKLPRMATISNEPMNKTYVISVSLLIFVLGILSYGVEQAFHHTPISYTGWANGFFFTLLAAGFSWPVSGRSANRRLPLK